MWALLKLIYISEKEFQISERNQLLLFQKWVITTLLIHKDSCCSICCLASGPAGGKRGMSSMALDPGLKMEFGNMNAQAGCENCHLEKMQVSVKYKG